MQYKAQNISCGENTKNESFKNKISFYELIYYVFLSYNYILPPSELIVKHFL
jgi:hypothetical protein